MSDSDNIRVRDSRMFNADGSIRSDDDVLAQEQAAVAQEAAQKAAASTPNMKNEFDFHKQASPHGTIDFTTFVLSLATSVQIALGVIPNPVTGKAEQDLINAQQTIDLLGMIETKTANNLTAEESGLLKQILFQLRMAFVELSKRSK